MSSCFCSTELTLIPGPGVPSFEAPIQNSDLHVQGRAGRHSFLSEQVIDRIKAITMNEDETHCLSDEAAQTLIDVVHEVCLHG